MKLGTFLTIKALVSFVFAFLELLLPAMMLSSFGTIVTPEATYLMRTLGAAFLGIGLVCWFASKAAHSELRKGVLLALFCCDTIGFVVALWAQLSGIGNATGWGLVIIWLLLAAGLGYFRFLRSPD